MRFKNNKRSIILFHIISPVFVIAMIILYVIAPKSKEIIYTIVVILLLDFLFNIFTLFITYNEIELTKSSLIIRKGVIRKNKFIMPYRDIKGLEKTGIELSGFKPFLALIPLKGLSYSPNRDKFKIYKAYIDDLDFKKLEDEISRAIKR